MAADNNTSIKAAILKCDDVLDRFEVVYGGYPEMIRSSFEKLDARIEFDVFDVRKLEKPERVDSYVFYVITGSKHSVYEDEIWIKELISFINEIELHKKKLYGICFGHQLIAIARGCDVSKSSKGWGVGVSVNRVLDHHFFSLNKKEINLLVSHQDQVNSLTAEAKLIATSNFCEHFMVRWSDSTISVQGHPEWEKGYSKDLMNDRRDRIEKEVIEAGIASLSQDIDNLAFNKSVLRFLLES